MKSERWFVWTGLGALVAACSFSAVQGQGGADTPAIPTADSGEDGSSGAGSGSSGSSAGSGATGGSSGNDGSSSGGSTSSSGNDGSSSGSTSGGGSGTGSSSGVDSGGSSGGQSSVIDCSTPTTPDCPVPVDQCCYVGDAGTGTCSSAGTSCPGLAVSCAMANNCGSTRECCFDGRSAVACGTCGASERVCGSASDCGDGGACALVSCPGLPVNLAFCEVPAGCTPLDAGH